MPIIRGARLAALASALPETVTRTSDLSDAFGDEAVRKLSESLGVESRHVARGLCASDLCVAAAEALFQGSGISRESIDGLIMVSQTPDYVLPATACSVHARLGLSSRCAAFDVNLGCSGYVYGLWLASSLVSSGGLQKILLLCGDTVSRVVARHDRTTSPLFGDAGTASLIQSDAEAPPLSFVLGTDGEGASNLIVKGGGFRPSDGQPATPQLFMDGAEVFSFTLKRVPTLVREVLAEADWTMDRVDRFVFHQANTFLLKHLTKRLKLSPEKVVLDMKHHGNTSSASIPLAMAHAIPSELEEGPMRLLLAGFGVGYSWAGAAMTCGPLSIAPPVLVSEPEGQPKGQPKGGAS